MKNPNAVNLQTTDEVRAAGWQAESRDGDGHLTRVHGAFAFDDQIAEFIHEAFEHGETVTLWSDAPQAYRSPIANAALIRKNRKMIGVWGEIVEDGPEGNEPLGAVVRALEKTNNALASRPTAKRREASSAVREALEALLVEALGSELHSPSNDRGYAAIAKARTALGGKWAVVANQEDGNAE